MERIKKLLTSPEPVKWVFEGDSITHGAFHTFGTRDYTELFCERLRFELGRPRDIVIKSAISGFTTWDILKDFDWRVAQFQPDVVFVMIGMNDCSTDRNIPLESFRNNLEEIARQVVALGALPVLQTTCPVLPGAAPSRERSYDAFMEVIREVAVAERLPLIDHTRFWRETFKTNPGVQYYWMNDAFHPNGHGHIAFARLLFRELGILNPASKTCQLFLP